MVSKCANPVCSAAFRYLHEGKLFHVAVGSAASEKGAALERFWLCDECSRTMTVISNGVEGQIVLIQQRSGSHDEFSAPF